MPGRRKLHIFFSSYLHFSMNPGVNMRTCKVCSGEDLKITGSQVRSMFSVECLSKNCGAKYMMQISLRSAVEGLPSRSVTVKPVRRQALDEGME